MSSNRTFIVVIFVLSLYWVLKLYYPFLINITIASLLAVAMYNINVFFSRFTKKTIVQATFTTLVLCILLMAPIAYVLVYLAKLPSNFDTNMFNTFITFIKNLQYKIPESLDFLKPYVIDFLQDINIAAITNKILSYATTAGKLGVSFFINAGLIIIFFFFALLYGKSISDYIKSILPMHNNEVEVLFGEIANVMGVVFYSLILNAMLQGALFGIMITFVGYSGLLFGILFGIASLVPLFGGALVWVPVAALEYSHGNTSTAIFIALYSIIVISITADTIVKPYMIKWINEKLVRVPTKINELLIFFSMIAGLASFGFWGVILGPVITTFFISILKIYRMIKDGSIAELYHDTEEKESVT